MVDIVLLDNGCEPPPDERYLIIEWRRTGSGCAVRHEAMGIRYVVGPDRHAFWTVEARHLAKRLKFDRIYFKSYPNAQTEPNRQTAAARR